MQKPGQFFGYVCFNVKRYRNPIACKTLSSRHLPNKQTIALQYLKSVCPKAKILYRSQYFPSIIAICIADLAHITHDCDMYLFKISTYLQRSEC